MYSLKDRIYKKAYSILHDKIKSEDVVQEVFLIWQEYEKRNGKQSKQTIDQSVIEAIRRIFGDFRAKCSKSRFEINHGFCSIGESIDSISSENRNDSGDFERYRRDVDKYLKTLNDTEYLIFRLRVDEGFSEAKIGDFLRITESRVCQRIKRICRRLSEAKKAEELRIEREGEGAMEKIPRKKTKRIEWTMASRTFIEMAQSQSFAMASFNEEGIRERTS